MNHFKAPQCLNSCALHQNIVLEFLHYFFDLSSTSLKTSPNASAATAEGCTKYNRQKNYNYGDQRSQYNCLTSSVLSSLHLMGIYNVLHIWHIRAIPTFRVYRLYDSCMQASQTTSDSHHPRTINSDLGMMRQGYQCDTIANIILSRLILMNNVNNLVDQ